MKFFDELKRRNVFRVAGVYAVVGWLVIQVIVAVKAPLDLPAWTDTLFIVVVLAGFPVALILAWAFELTPEGMKLTANVAEGESIAPKTGRKLDYVIVGGLALVGVMIIADRLMPEETAPRAAGPAATAANAAPAAASIAVLPFADLSPGGDQTYFSDGVSEEILNVLARIEGLKVASRTSSFQFRSSAAGVPAIARELGVRHVLEGSVRKAGETIRVTAQLIDAQTDAHLWSETYDRPLSTETVFAIQDEIAGAIVAALRGKMGVASSAAAPALQADTENLDAYELYLKARTLFVARGTENLRQSMAALERAIEIDPAFARAHELLSAVYAIARNWGIAGKDYDSLALAAAENALRLNPELAQPHATRGFVGKSLMLTGADFTWEGTLADLNEAVRRDPLSPTAWFWRGLHYLDLGSFDVAAADMKECFRLDPAYQNCRRFAAIAQLHAGREDEALALYEAGLRDGFSNSNLPFAARYAARGDAAAALAVLNLTFTQTPNIVEPLYRAMLGETVTAEEREAALHLLDDVDRSADAQSARFWLKDYAAVAEDPNPLGGPSLYWYPYDAAFLKSPERKALIRRLRLPDYWRKHGFPPQCKPVGRDDFACE